MENASKSPIGQSAKLLGTYVVTLVGIGGILFLSLSMLPLAATEMPAKAPVVSFQ